MRFTWHDAVATTLVGAAVAAETLHLAGLDLPGLGSGRALTGAVLVLGLAACATGATTEMSSLPVTYVWPMALLGTAAIVAGLAGLITGAFAMAAVLTAVTLAMWLAATIRHTVAPVPRVTDKALRELIDRHKAEVKS
jgi:hypothetical protein